MTCESLIGWHASHSDWREKEREREREKERKPEKSKEKESVGKSGRETERERERERESRKRFAEIDWMKNVTHQSFPVDQIEKREEVAIEKKKTKRPRPLFARPQEEATPKKKIQ